MVYLERLKKLRAAGGLAETGNIDQENVENYSARVKTEAGQGQASTAYSSGVGEFSKTVEVMSLITFLFFQDPDTVQ